ncbi:MAG: radical SAM protein [Bacteroidetes bacterium]|jgi:radical SAM enzyme (TIGR01210 family)|nr:radical SAM protein [Bacteroidota bacterium]
MPDALPRFSDDEIVAARPSKADVDPAEPYAYHVEPERTAAGMVEDVATIFLTNRECPFRCLMCDLWKHTTDETVPEGAIPAQIDVALDRLPPARHIKLYNSGNFFDRKAIPPSDYDAIAERVAGFNTVIVENHPKLCNDTCVAFRDRLDGQFEIALGLETAHPTVLDRLNKRMTRDDFRRAVAFLRTHDIDVRTFILLRPPFMSEAEGVEWALRSIEFAFDAGVQTCSVVPTRPGNGMMQQLAADGHYAPPAMASIETVLEEGMQMDRGRVFMDLWDLERFYDCPDCGPERRERLHQMNLTQTVQPPIACPCAVEDTP